MPHPGLAVITDSFTSLRSTLPIDQPLLRKWFNPLLAAIQKGEHEKVKEFLCHDFFKTSSKEEAESVDKFHLYALSFYHEFLVLQYNYDWINFLSEGLTKKSEKNLQVIEFLAKNFARDKLKGILQVGSEFYCKEELATNLKLNSNKIDINIENKIIKIISLSIKSSSDQVQILDFVEQQAQSILQNKYKKILANIEEFKKFEGTVGCEAEEKDLIDSIKNELDYLRKDKDAKHDYSTSGIREQRLRKKLDLLKIAYAKTLPEGHENLTKDFFYKVTGHTLLHYAIYGYPIEVAWVKDEDALPHIIKADKNSNKLDDALFVYLKNRNEWRFYLLEKSDYGDEFFTINVESPLYKNLCKIKSPYLSLDDQIVLLDLLGKEHSPLVTDFNNYYEKPSTFSRLKTFQYLLDLNPEDLFLASRKDNITPFSLLLSTYYNPGFITLIQDKLKLYPNHLSLIQEIQINWETFNLEKNPKFSLEAHLKSIEKELDFANIKLLDFKIIKLAKKEETLYQQLLNDREVITFKHKPKINKFLEFQKFKFNPNINIIFSKKRIHAIDINLGLNRLTRGKKTVEDANSLLEAVYKQVSLYIQADYPDLLIGSLNGFINYIRNKIGKTNNESLSVADEVECLKIFTATRDFLVSLQLVDLGLELNILYADNNGDINIVDMSNIANCLKNKRNIPIRIICTNSNHYESLFVIKSINEDTLFSQPSDSQQTQPKPKLSQLQQYEIKINSYERLVSRLKNFVEFRKLEVFKAITANKLGSLVFYTEDHEFCNAQSSFQYYLNLMQETNYLQTQAQKLVCNQALSIAKDFQSNKIDEKKVEEELLTIKPLLSIEGETKKLDTIAKILFCEKNTSSTQSLVKKEESTKLNSLTVHYTNEVTKERAELIQKFEKTNKATIENQILFLEEKLSTLNILHPKEEERLYWQERNQILVKKIENRQWQKQKIDSRKLREEISIKPSTALSPLETLWAKQSSLPLLNFITVEGDSAVALAIKSGQVDILKYLLEQGCNTVYCISQTKEILIVELVAQVEKEGAFQFGNEKFTKSTIEKIRTILLEHWIRTPILINVPRVSEWMKPLIDLKQIANSQAESLIPEISSLLLRWQDPHFWIDHDYIATLLLCQSFLQKGLILSEINFDHTLLPHIIEQEIKNECSKRESAKEVSTFFGKIFSIFSSTDETKLLNYFLNKWKSLYAEVLIKYHLAEIITDEKGNIIASAQKPKGLETAQQALIGFSTNKEQWVEQKHLKEVITQQSKMEQELQAIRRESEDQKHIIEQHSKAFIDVETKHRIEIEQFETRLKKMEEMMSIQSNQPSSKDKPQEQSPLPIIPPSQNLHGQFFPTVSQSQNDAPPPKQSSEKPGDNTTPSLTQDSK